ncbi:MAG TPA: hypothetical protein VH120_11690 [Gemmataceae bacterium]|jgi:hypothetical protein|nr:hypothetical protein [Gemmataceae bacterium]
MTRPFAALALGCLAILAEPSAAAEKSASAQTDPTIAKLSQFIGGAWVNDNPNFKIEIRYQWVFNKTAIRSTGIIDKGGPHETAIESTVGWDPARKVAYYVDFHGGQTVFNGTAKLEGDEIHFDFVTLIGPPAKWRSVGKLPTPDQYEFTIFSEKDGKWTPAHEIKLHRVKQ